MLWTAMKKEELLAIRDAEAAKLSAYKEKGIRLDLTRGKPGRDQLDLTDGMLTVLSGGEDCRTAEGFDCRNYGLLTGIPEAKALFSQLFGIPESRLLIAGNSSLNLMFDAVSRCMLFGTGGHTPWSRREKVKFLCPAPGYDRHFAVTAAFGIEMIPVPMTAEGPDMAAVERLVQDPAVVGMWCVPKFSNPEGVVYSDATVTALAAMETAAPDFRLFWDNAYAVHELYGEEVPLLDIFAEAEKYGHLDRVFYFASTSKISYPGAGVALFAASEANIAEATKVLTVQTIGHDKVNQLRHVRYFKDAAGVKAHMRRHAAILRPKFEAVDEILTAGLSGTGIATWTKPQGGYFISLNTLPGLAKRVYAIAKDTGVTLTAAGATYPYGVDPEDKNLRLAPSFPEREELRAATEILVSCIRYATAEMLTK